MKTSTRVLLALGAIATSIPLLMNSMIRLSDSADGFLRGFGLTLIAGAVVFQWRHKNHKTAC
ncbi:MAG: hypothetical protein K0S09_1648 [Sphingobacteriaceae bacterium]|jgi:hypothetical protein|nr:hypothetical protein [Sphingobacteriaceae bacterium]